MKKQKKKSSSFCRRIILTLGVAATAFFVGVAMMPAEVSAKVVDSGKIGTVTWKLEDSGKLTIGGSGKMKSEDDFSNYPWWKSEKKVTSVVIGKKVTKIGDHAFVDWRGHGIKKSP